MQATIAMPEKPHAGEERFLSILVILTALVGLLLGWILKVGVENRSSKFSGLDGALSLRYPATWVVGEAEDEETLLTVYDPRATATFNPTFSVRARPMPKDQRLLDAATNWTLGRTKSLREFHDLGTEPTFVQGQMAIRVNYAYIADPPVGSGPAMLPIVARGADTLVVHGDQLLVFSALSDAAHYDEYAPRLEKILASANLAAR